MPNFNIIKQSKPSNSFRVASIKGMFDIDKEIIKEHFEGEIKLPEKWNIGIIYGASGTGKTTIAKELFGENIVTEKEYNQQSLVDDMPKDKTVKEITQMFNTVGFSSPPCWLKPYSVLANGEKMRVDLANALLEEKDMICFDEFTSVVNREVAKIGSYAIQKTVRKKEKKFIAISCHDDVIEWLEPDWIFCTDTMTFSTEKKNDQTLTSQYMSQARIFGKCLASIII